MSSREKKGTLEGHELHCASLRQIGWNVCRDRGWAYFRIKFVLLVKGLEGREVLSEEGDVLLEE